MLREVYKHFSADGIDLKIGDIVETSHWKNEKLLIEYRMIGEPRVPHDKLNTLKPVNVKKDQPDVQAAAIPASAKRVEEPKTVTGKRVPPRKR